MKQVQRGGLPLGELDSLAAEPGLVHAVSTRHGGVSPAPFDTLNLSLSTADTPANVEANRDRLAAAVGAERGHIIGSHQVHGTRAVKVDGQAAAELRHERADILITDCPGRFLSLRFADCVPVLLYDPRRRCIGLVHAGWRGTAADAAGAGVRALADAFGSRPRDVVAGIGPSIGPCCYEVGEETAAEFKDRPRGVLRSGGKPVLDLWTLNRDALARAGVPAERIEVSGVCTKCNARDFFSHRAAGGGPSGRFGAVMGLV